jgi:hypothetical protein
MYGVTLWPAVYKFHCSISLHADFNSLCHPSAHCCQPTAAVAKQAVSAMLTKAKILIIMNEDIINGSVYAIFEQNYQIVKIKVL